MEKADFDIWWKEYLIDCKSDKEGYISRDNLERYVTFELPEDKREVFLDELVNVLLAEGDGYGYAAAALEKSATESQLSRLFTNIKNRTYIPSEDPYCQFSWILCILAKRNYLPAFPLIKDFLNKYPYDKAWFAVAWSIWPINKPLFLEVWQQYLLNVPYSKWFLGVIVLNKDVLYALYKKLGIYHPVILFKLKMVVSRVPKNIELK